MPNISMNKDAPKLAPIMLGVGDNLKKRDATIGIFATETYSIAVHLLERQI